MNEPSEALAAAMTAHRFADEDAERRVWLDAHTKPGAPKYEAPEDEGCVPVFCVRGHSAWSRRSRGKGQKEKRYCVVCHRDRMVEQRKQTKAKNEAQLARDIARAKAKLSEKGIAV